MRELDRIADSNYVPNDEDILSVFRPTTIAETLEVTISDVRFRITDIGGQRNGL